MGYGDGHEEAEANMKGEAPLETALRLTMPEKEQRMVVGRITDLPHRQTATTTMNDEEVVRLVEGVMRRTFRRFQEKLPSGDDYVRRAVDRMLEGLHEMAVQSYREVIEARAPRKVGDRPRKRS